ncbi:uncharacterized protein TNCV_1371371 [Trichonephila clavipes]|nr:uncharacterized protein TNCV_1371371 [Trichonephila clavipes]
MKLHKWGSSHPELASNIIRDYEFKNPIETKTLGVSWKSQEDCFTFKIAVELKDSYTKRCVLSTIARLFDLLGLLGPVVAKAKIFMQSLWDLKIDWIEELPSERVKEWHRFLEDFNSVSSICIGRCIPHPQATRLIKRVETALQMETTPVYIWIYSTVVLEWIQKEPNLLKTFVANRVATIQHLTNAEQWHNVSSEQNPADLASRGSLRGWRCVESKSKTYYIHVSIPEQG